MKKFLSLILCLSVAISALCTSTSATQLDTQSPENEYVKNTSYGRSAVTVADIDALMEDLNEAVLTDDIEAEKKIKEELAQSGAIPTSYSDVLKLTGVDNIPYANVNIDFNTVYSEIYTEGKNIEIMRIYATPKRGSAMFHEGWANSQNTNTLQAGSINALKTWGEFGASYIPYVGTALPVFDALKSTISGFKATNLVENVYIEYVYRCIENTTFLYFYNKNINTWTHIGTCSRLGTRVTSIVDKIKVKNFAALPGGYSKTYTDDIYARNYNNALNSYKYWKAYGPNFEQQAKDFSVSGAAGANKTAAVVKMLMPHIPAVCK